MDAPGVPTPLLEQTLVEIETINRMLGGYGPSLQGLDRLLRGRSLSAPLRVLDVGTGSADTPRAMHRWAAARGLAVHITAIDLSDATIAFARRQSEPSAGIDLRCQDLFQMPAEERFDVVHAALVLHHFPGELTVRALASMYERADFGIVINDLHRHPIAWAGIGLLTRAFSTNPMLQNDAPLSVLRGFRKDELVELADRAGLPQPEVVWRAMFRWLMVVERPR